MMPRRSLLTNVSKKAISTLLMDKNNNSRAEVRLVPVLEMSPEDYRRMDRPIPFNGSPDEHTRYWAACLADSGIEGLFPLKFRHVPVEQFASAHILEKILRIYRYREDSDSPEGAFDKFSDPEQYLIAFTGGYALYIDDHLACIPGCCGDLRDLQNWQMAADYREAEWRSVWIGHPWITVRYESGLLFFSDQDEGGDLTEWSDECAIAPEALQQAIVQAKTDLLDFSRRLLPVVESMVPPAQATEITDLLLTGKVFLLLSAI